jgi:hypothetical protein
MQYTSYISESITYAQEKKFKESVTCTDPDVWYEWEDEVIKVLKTPSFVSHQTCFEESWDHWSPAKFAPGIGGKSVSEANTRVQLDCFLETKFYRTVYYCTDFIGSEDQDYFLTTVLRYLHEKPRGEMPIGKISVIQEPGFKARFIANPNRVVQWLLQPLGDFLFKVIKELPWDCTFDQHKADNQIRVVLQENNEIDKKISSLKQEYEKNIRDSENLGYYTRAKTLRAHYKSDVAALEAGKQKVYCFDLSNATDRFPLGIQLSLMVQVAYTLPEVQRELMLSQCRFFELAARSEWIYKGDVLKWTRGQPLGLYPSFPLFALTHGMLLLSLYFQAHGDLPNWTVRTPFFVLGDDVIIFDDWLAISYQSALKDYAIPFSLGKSILSYKAAEFCGHLFTAQNYYIPTKWRCVSEESFIEFLKVWGIEGINLLPRHIRDVATVVARLPEPVGLGYNPEGVSLEERVEKYLELYCDESECPALSNKYYEGEANVSRILQNYGDLRLYRGVNTYFSEHRTDAKKLCILDHLVLRNVLTPKDIKTYLDGLIHNGDITAKEAVDLAYEAGYEVQKPKVVKEGVPENSLFTKIVAILSR